MTELEIIEIEMLIFMLIGEKKINIEERSKWNKN